MPERDCSPLIYATPPPPPATTPRITTRNTGTTGTHRTTRRVFTPRTPNSAPPPGFTGTTVPTQSLPPGSVTPKSTPQIPASTATPKTTPKPDTSTATEETTTNATIAQVKGEETSSNSLYHLVNLVSTCHSDGCIQHLFFSVKNSSSMDEFDQFNIYMLPVIPKIMHKVILFRPPPPQKKSKINKSNRKNPLMLESVIVIVFVDTVLYAVLGAILGPLLILVVILIICLIRYSKKCTQHSGGYSKNLGSDFLDPPL